jgi:cytochrome P450
MIEEVKKSGPGNILNEEVILAQGIVFFIAGFETSSNTMSSLAFNLAKNPDVQVRCLQHMLNARQIFRSMDIRTTNDLKKFDAFVKKIVDTIHYIIITNTIKNPDKFSL